MRCVVDDDECISGRLKRGMCNLHYQRQRRLGSTENPRKPTLTRYKVDEVTQCWVYEGPLYRNGYGKLSRKVHETRLAHRASFIEHRPEVEIEGLDLDHLCRNKACINPDHLDPQSRSINLRRGYDVVNQGFCKNKIHPKTPENVMLVGSSRVCRQCKLEKDRRAGARYRAKGKV